MNNKDKKDDNDLELINILYDEWKFRLSQYWSLTYQTILLSFILFFAPYLKDAWGTNILNLPNFIFPIAGIIFSIATCFVGVIEMKKINTIKNSIKCYISTHLQNVQTPYNYNNPLHHNLPIYICCIQMIIGIFVLFTVT